MPKSKVSTYRDEGRLTLYLGSFKDEVMTAARESGLSINGYIRDTLRSRVNRAKKRALALEKEAK